MATPEQCRNQIRSEYVSLVQRRPTLNNNWIVGVIENRCREAARHNGVPEYWREYLPDELKLPDAAGGTP